MNCLTLCEIYIGLIAAACGELDTVLHEPSSVGNNLSNEVGNEISVVKSCQYGIAMKPCYGPREHVYESCNGLHL